MLSSEADTKANHVAAFFLALGGTSAPHCRKELRQADSPVAMPIHMSL